MTVEVLISCMNQKNYDIIKNSNLLDNNVLVVNQCDINDDEMIQINRRHRIYNTKTRGLSVSRNIALDNARGDICVISDDDEVFYPGFEHIIEEQYKIYPEADIIIFRIGNHHKRLGNKVKWLKKYDALKVASVQMTFKKASLDDKIRFDTKLGAGTPNGGGEENKFILDCYKQGLKILYLPIDILDLKKGSSSTWFFGFTNEYFYNKGASNRYILGNFVGLAFSIYFVLTKVKLYNKDCSFIEALKSILCGYMNKKL